MTNLAKSQTNDFKNQRDINKAHTAFNDVPYCEEYRGLKRMGNTISVIASAFSWNTQVFGIGFLAFLWLSSFLDTKVALFFGGVFGFVGASVLEFAKRIISRLFFKGFYNEQKDTSLKLGSSIVVVVALSIGLSFYASLYIPNMVVDAPPLANIEEIKASFDVDVKDLQVERDKFRKSREYMGKLRKEEAAIVLEFNNKIEQLKTEKKEAIKTVKAENKALVSAWVTENNDVGFSIGWFMVLLEIFCIGGIAFNWHYQSKIRFDASPSPITSTEPPTTRKEERKGFKTTSKDNLNKERQVISNEATEAEHSHDNCQTITTEKEADSPTGKTKVTDLEYMEVVSNAAVDDIKRLKDAIGKNYKRSFTSANVDVRERNYDKAMNRCLSLQEKYGIECVFDVKTQKVSFKTLQAA